MASFKPSPWVPVAAGSVPWSGLPAAHPPAGPGHGVGQNTSRLPALRGVRGWHQHGKSTFHRFLIFITNLAGNSPATEG